MGALWGSFANVCIYRLPLNKGIVTGRSFCTQCKKKIPWYDNIPLISFIIIKGRCRKCEKKISPNYLIVEILSSLSFFVIYFFYGATATALFLIILGAWRSHSPSCPFNRVFFYRPNPLSCKI